MARPQYGWGYRKARARILAGNPSCQVRVSCSGAPATETDHDPPVALHRHVEGTACCTLRPSCARCARAQGAALATALSAAGFVPARPLTAPTSSPAPPTVAADDPVGLGSSDPVWAVPWLDDLRDVPAGATWPRLMTVPHPAATGSYGARFADGRQLRWWQRLAAVRLLEHDAVGQLCWPTALVSTSRQVGKSYLLRELCRWRLDESGDLFTPEQLILHTARKLAVAVEVQRPARRLAKLHPDRYKVSERPGEQQIERLDDGARWMVRAKNNVVSLTVDVAVVDEAWDVEAALIETDVVPTMVERPNAQLLMWSTAHRKATSLVMNRRATLDVADTGAGLHVEWSAARDADVDDRDAWRAASPHWSQRREDLIAARLAAALAGETDDPDEPDPLAAFTSQWLNWWPHRDEARQPGDPLVDAAAWALCEGALELGDTRGYVALEDHLGEGAAVAFAAGDDAGRFEVDGLALDTWDDALRWARKFVDQRPGSHLIVGASLRNQVPNDFPNRMALRTGGVAETKRALPLLRNLVAERRLCHDGTVDLDAQIATARVRANAQGVLALISTTRSDLLRAALWALLYAQTPPANPKVH